MVVCLDLSLLHGRSALCVPRYSGPSPHSISSPCYVLHEPPAPVTSHVDQCPGMGAASHENLAWSREVSHGPVRTASACAQGRWTPPRRRSKRPEIGTGSGLPVTQAQTVASFVRGFAVGIEGKRYGGGEGRGAVGVVRVVGE